MVTKVNEVKNSHGGIITLPLPPCGRPWNGYIRYFKLMLRNLKPNLKHFNLLVYIIFIGNYVTGNFK